MISSGQGGGHSLTLSYIIFMLHVCLPAHHDTNEIKDLTQNESVHTGKSLAGSGQSLLTTSQSILRALSQSDDFPATYFSKDAIFVHGE